MIRAAGSHLTNIINGSVFGLMKNSWSPTEIRNFGEMILYFSLRQCIIERPRPVYPKDVCTKPVCGSVSEPKKYFIGSNYELNGILEYLLNL